MKFITIEIPGLQITEKEEAEMWEAFSKREDYFILGKKLIWWITETNEVLLDGDTVYRKVVVE